MLEKLRKTLYWLSFGCLLPATTSLLLQIPGEPGWLLAILVGYFPIGFFVAVPIISDGYGDEESMVTTFTHIVWSILAIFINSMTHGHYSMPRTTLLLMSVAYAILLPPYIKLALEKRKSDAEAAKAAEVRKQLVEEIGKIVGDSAQVQALITAIERTTEYVPEVGDRLLGALRRDLERFLHLRSLESTTTNDVLRQKSKQEADEIASTIRELTAETTEMALEILREYQAIEADTTLGDDSGPEIVRARADFRRFLDGLKETNRETPGSTRADEVLREEIAALGAQPEVKQLPAPQVAVDTGRKGGELVIEGITMRRRGGTKSC